MSDHWGHWDHLSRLKITNGKPWFGESKRGLTLAGALRWNGDSYRAGHWPWTTENFFFSFLFFPLCLNPQAWFHLVERFFSWNCWIHRVCKPVQNIFVKPIFRPFSPSSYWGLFQRPLFTSLLVIGCGFKSSGKSLRAEAQLDLMYVQAFSIFWVVSVKGRRT